VRSVGRETWCEKSGVRKWVSAPSR
jgi:hypothetical protein